MAQGMKNNSARHLASLLVLVGTLVSAFSAQAAHRDDVARKTDAQSFLNFQNSTPSSENTASAEPTRPTGWRGEQDDAVRAARGGNYDEALAKLNDLHKAHPESLSVATDYAAILGWAGHDEEAVTAYESLAAGNRPDYLVDAIGHSYRNLHQPEKALDVYRLGLTSAPGNQSFVAGEILSLHEAGQDKDAREKALEAINEYSTPSDALTVAIKQTFRADAVALGRAGKYDPSLKEMEWLHRKYPADADISSDYMSVLSWSGHDAQAIALYQSMPQNDQPVYILNAAAHSYRALHQQQKAVALYQQVLKQDPNNMTATVGIVDCMVDAGRGKESVAFIKAHFGSTQNMPKEVADAYKNAERGVAIEMAREGHYDQALVLLKELHKRYPGDTGEQMDYIAVSSWAGHHNDAINEYAKIAGRSMPDYVLAAVGHSYREAKQSDKALIVYRRGHKQSPQNPAFVEGEIRCLNDLARYAEGRDLADDYSHHYGDRLEVLVAGGESANLNDEPKKAMSFYKRAQAISPRNREVLQGLVRTEDRLGAPQTAISIANAHPGLISVPEYAGLVGNYDSMLVQNEVIDAPTYQERYVSNDKALASLDQHIADWTATGNPALGPNIRRARVDRLIALRDHGRLQEVVDSYNDLVEDGVEVPTYALDAVGESYLSLRQPQIARDIFQKVLTVKPDDYAARRLLANAYFECDQYDEAYATSEQLVADQSSESNRKAAVMQAGLLRAYGEYFDDADSIITPMVEATPDDASVRAAAGNLYMMRGQRRKALEQFEAGTQVAGRKDLGNEIGIAGALLGLHHFQEAEAKTQDLVARYPESNAVKNAARDIEIYHMAEIDAHAGYAFSPSQSVTNSPSPNGQGYWIGAEIYSSPIDYNWRLFAGQDYAHQHEANAEGLIDVERSNAGVEYRKGDVTARVAPTINVYNGNQRIGGFGTFHYSFNDMWSTDIAAELFSSQTPLRALNQGVTSNLYTAGLVWRANEGRQVAVNLGAMTFSDHNVRTMQDAEYIERLYTSPNFKLDADTTIDMTQDSKDANRFYFNPRSDVLAMVGLRGTQTLYHWYNTLYEHSLMARAGVYDESKYGASAAWNVRYEQRVHYNKTTEFGAGVDYLHHDYDGSASDAVSLTMDMVERF